MGFGRVLFWEPEIAAPGAMSCEPPPRTVMRSCSLQLAPLEAR
jgi:hypothetical protein